MWVGFFWFVYDMYYIKYLFVYWRKDALLVLCVFWYICVLERRLCIDVYMILFLLYGCVFYILKWGIIDLNFNVCFFVWFNSVIS